ncbi:MAG: CCA tRNA nucleotidyltransferase [Fimbriimonadaceae bacterium]|nr:CCA tRNA nucleotidyltransferase [Fimbriimonadaceae bacterium]
MDPLARLIRELGSRAATVQVVGGSVRDRLLGRGVVDFDLITTDALELARWCARRLEAWCITLDDERGTARLITRDRALQCDFAERQGSLDADLRQRDFCINAIACELVEWPTAAPHWVDPTGGLADLAARQIRLAAPGSLAADPLRCVRAYRFAAQLGFELHPTTRAAVAATAGRLSEVAAERVWQELRLWLAAPHCAAALADSAADGLLGRLLPEVPPTHLARLPAGEAWLARLAACEPAWMTAEERLPLWRLAVLLGQPPAAVVHALVDRLRLSREQARRLLAWTQPLAGSGPPELAALVLRNGAESYGTLLQAVVSGELDEPAAAAGLGLLTEQVLPAWRATPWVSGRDLQQAGWQPGPAFGPALERARLAQLSGAAADAAAARAVALQFMEDSASNERA